MFTIDPTGISALDVEEKTALDRATGVRTQRMDRESGLPLWSIAALKRTPGEKAEILTVTIASATRPSVEPMTQTFEHLQLGYYEINGEGGAQSGLYFRAAALVPIAAPSKSREGQS
jgi:hypothetical protein